MVTTTTNFSWVISDPAEAQFQDLWGAQTITYLTDQDTELFKTKIKGKETIWVPSKAMAPITTNGAAAITLVELTSGQPELEVIDFDQTTNESVQFSVAFPKSWDEGTVTFQPIWTTASANGNTVEWDLQGVAIGNDDAIDVAYGTLQTSIDTALGTINDFHIGPESSAITIAGSPAVDENTWFKLTRDASSDSHTSDARLIGIKLFFTTDGRSDD